MPDCSNKSTPSLIIIPSNAQVDWKKLIDGILDTAPASTHQNSDVGFPVLYRTDFVLSNRYYKATIQLLVATQSWPQHTSNLKRQGEALILYWDNTEPSCLTTLNDAYNALDGFLPEVCLLVCDSFQDQSRTSRNDAKLWCADHGWELVELDDATEGSEVEEEEDVDFLFSEQRSFGRIRDALNANTWTNMELCTEDRSSLPASRAADTSRFDPADCMLPDSSDPILGSANNTILDDDVARDDNQENGTDFEDLFSRFQEMRLTASSLSGENRLDYAEKVAMSFLESMGLDADDDSDAADGGGSNATAKNEDSKEKVKSQKKNVGDKVSKEEQEIPNDKENRHETTTNEHPTGDVTAALLKDAFIVEPPSEITFETLSKEFEMDPLVSSEEELGFPILEPDCSGNENSVPRGSCVAVTPVEESPCMKEESPCMKKEESPCMKEESPSLTKEDSPCMKKDESPCMKKEESHCMKNEESLCMNDEESCAMDLDNSSKGSTDKFNKS